MVKFNACSYAAIISYSNNDLYHMQDLLFSYWGCGNFFIIIICDFSMHVHVCKLMSGTTVDTPIANSLLMHTKQGMAQN